MTTITNYEQIVQLINDFQLLHGQLNDFGVGPTSDISTKRNMKFPYIWMTHSQASTISLLPENMVTIPVYSLTFLFLDKINIQTGDDENGLRSDNQIYIMSDMHQVAMDFVGYLMRTGTFLDEQQLSIEPIYDETTDKVSGWKLDIDIKLPYVNCSIPLK